MKIAVFGLGYVGITTVAALTRQGHSVLGFDVNEGKVRDINAGRSPIAEPGVGEQLRVGIASGTLACRSKVDDGLGDCDAAIVCVGTPSGADGAHNMTYIAQVSKEIAAALRCRDGEALPVVYRSTFRPGTMEELVAPIFRATKGETAATAELVYNPEFLRESSALSDYFDPPKIVIGTRDGRPCEVLERLYSGCTAPKFVTRYREAELTKFVDNTFHAVKVAFANEIGRVCVSLGISAAQVHEIFVSDTKLNISPYYLRPGGAFGGSCLPKDVRALQFIANEVGLNNPLTESVLRSNEAHKHFLFERCMEGLPPSPRILLLGLAFKKNTDDLRESPQVDLARRLLQRKCRLSIYDPTLDPAKLVGQNLGYAYSHLPSFAELLVSGDEAIDGTYDLIIDANGTGDLFAGRDVRVMDITTLS